MNADVEVEMSVKQSWGCGTARYCSGLAIDVLQVDVPLGTCIERWDGETGERLFSFQAHKQVITAMRRAPECSWKETLVMTASDGGVLSLWDGKWKLLASLNTSACPLRHVGSQWFTASLFLYVWISPGTKQKGSHGCITLQIRYSPSLHYAVS